MVSPDIEHYGLAPWPLIVVPIPFIIATIIALSLRLWVRCFVTRSFGLDDGFLIAAFIGFLTEAISLMIVGKIELDHGIVGPALALAKTNFAGITGYIVGQICFKLSLAIFFLRILLKSWQRWMIIGTVTVFITYTTALFFVTIFECGDPGSPSLETATCLDWDTTLGPINYIGAALNAIVDWIFALVPILVIQTLRMTRNGKSSVIALILLAVSGSIISVLRIPYINGLNPSMNYYSKASDRIAYISIAEGGVGIIAVSLATLKPLFKKWLHSTRGSSPRNSDKRLREERSASWAARRIPGYRNPRKFSLMIEDVEMQDRDLPHSGNAASIARSECQSSSELSEYPRFGLGIEREVAPHIFVSTQIDVESIIATPKK